MMMKLENGTPVLQLLKTSEMLSVNQLVAYTTLMIAHKVQVSKEPKYLADRLKPNAGGRINIFFKLSRSREGYMYRAGKCFSLLPPELKLETKKGVFKKKLRKWVKENIPAIPY